MTESIIRNIKDFYVNKILGDRYLQLFIVDKIYFSNTIPHEYSIFKKVINSIDPPNRNDIWFLDWVPGFPKIISIDNLPGLKTVNLSGIYNNLEMDKDYIKVGDFEIYPPELVTNDPRHKSRYNIFNTVGDRKTKRLRISPDRCIKFYNTHEDNMKTLFKVKKHGEEFGIGSLTYQDYVIIKLTIMRNKPFLKLIFEVITELLKSVGKFSDSVFLGNSFIVDPEKENTKLSLIWSTVSKEKSKENGVINLTII